MKISKNAQMHLVLFSFFVLFTFGCTEKDTTDKESEFEGYVFDVESGIVLVAYDIKVDKFNQIQGKSLHELDNEEYIPLIYLSYNDTSNFKIGDKVNVWIDGGIDDSHPQRAAAKKIEIIN